MTALRRISDRFAASPGADPRAGWNTRNSCFPPPSAACAERRPSCRSRPKSSLGNTKARDQDPLAGPLHLHAQSCPDPTVVQSSTLPGGLYDNAEQATYASQPLWLPLLSLPATEG